MACDVGCWARKRWAIHSNRTQHHPAARLTSLSGQIVLEVSEESRFHNDWRRVPETAVQDGMCTVMGLKPMGAYVCSVVCCVFSLCAGACSHTHVHAWHRAPPPPPPAHTPTRPPAHYSIHACSPQPHCLRGPPAAHPPWLLQVRGSHLRPSGGRALPAVWTQCSDAHPERAGRCQAAPAGAGGAPGHGGARAE